ncbi:MAG: methyltransferase domain-containing protein [Clostridiales bacterium]|nr:methyltransferase domain-containing protein [Clostridiales bacterium]
MDVQVAPDHYYIKYDTLERFCSYWHQINEVTSYNPKSILELGIGNGFVSRYLKHIKFNIITMDFDKGLRPDVTGNILNLPFSDEAFDVVACFEVLEHLPFDNFKSILSEFARISKSHVVLSIPDANREYRVFLHIPKHGRFKKVIQIPRLRRLIHNFDGQHYWELGKKGYTLKTITGCINDARLKIEKTYRPFEWPYHRFFCLTKK